MEIWPWDTTSVSAVCSLNAVSALSFCVVLFKIKGIKDNTLLVKLSLILIASQIASSIFTYLNFKVHELNEEAGKETKKQININIVAFTNLGIYYWCYCSAHWIFAMKYWALSY